MNSSCKGNYSVHEDDKKERDMDSAKRLPMKNLRELAKKKKK